MVRNWERYYYSVGKGIDCVCVCVNLLLGAVNLPFFFSSHDAPLYLNIACILTFLQTRRIFVFWETRVALG